MTSPGPDSSVAGPRPSPTPTAAPSDAAPSSSPSAAVSLRNIWRTYALKRGRERTSLVALQGVSLDIPTGQRMGLLGPNGSGKSTLLRILATLDQPDPRDGTSVRILAGAASSPAHTRARLGVVFQHPGLDTLLSVRENLAAQAALYGLKGAHARERIAWAASRLGLTDRMDDRVGILSGGLVRRVDLARALLHDPDLLLLDEPTTGLDPRAREDFLATVESVQAEPRAPGRPRMTVIMSTHLMEEAGRADRVVLLHRGKVVADEAPDALRRRVGGIIIRCHAPGPAAGEAESILTRAGLAVAAPASADAPEATIVGRVPHDRSGLEEALVGLTRAEIPFEVGPPTLSDVFLSLTGEEIGEDAPAPQPEHRGRTRRPRR